MLGYFIKGAGGYGLKAQSASFKFQVSGFKFSSSRALIKQVRFKSYRFRILVKGSRTMQAALLFAKAHRPFQNIKSEDVFDERSE